MPSFLQELKAYFKTRFDLLKYESIDSATAIIADMVVDFVIITALALFFLFFTTALGFYLSQIFQSNWAGFGIVTLLYVLIAIFGHLLKSPLQNVLIRVLITKVFKKK